MSKFKKYFNSNTIRGRANVAKATYASFAALYLVYRFRRKGHKPKDDHEVDYSAKRLDEESHRRNAPDPEPEAEPTCPCKCNENAESSNGHTQHSDKGHNGRNAHPDDTHSNSSNHGHHNGKKDDEAQAHNDPHDTHGKSADIVNYKRSNSLESSSPDTESSKKSFFSYMDDSVITWGLP